MYTHVYLENINNVKNKMLGKYLPFNKIIYFFFIIDRTVRQYNFIDLTQINLRY